MFYKMYNNSQLKRAQSSSLGVDINSSTVSAVGQADDVILAANSVESLSLLAKLTESYCASHRVKLVPSKTKLLPLYLPRHECLVEYARLVNPVTIDSAPVQFVKEAEHVGVVRIGIHVVRVRNKGAQRPLGTKTKLPSINFL